jgi:hypothetical protein
MVLIWGQRKAIYFLAQDWTAKISLKGLGKFRLSRKPLCGGFDRWAWRQVIDVPDDGQLAEVQSSIFAR